MLAALDRSELRSKDDWSLIWTCVSSFILEVRGKSELVKMDLYGRLSTHQRRVFIFVVYYSHARESASSLLYYSREFIHAGYWRELEKAIRFFDDAQLLELMAAIENACKAAPIMEWPQEDLDRALADKIRRLFGPFVERSAETVRTIGGHLRANPSRYFDLAG
jgi:hypothetical protein